MCFLSLKTVVYRNIWLDGLGHFKEPSRNVGAPHYLFTSKKRTFSRPAPIVNIADDGTMHEVYTMVAQYCHYCPYSVHLFCTTVLSARTTRLCDSMAVASSHNRPWQHDNARTRQKRKLSYNRVVACRLWQNDSTTEEQCRIIKLSWYAQPRQRDYAINTTVCTVASFLLIEHAQKFQT